MSLRLIVLRHGSTRWNRERRYQGCVDTPLSAEGRTQAAAAARLLAGRPLAAVYASPLARARETAAAIAEPHGLPVLSAPAFREICLGLWEGMTIPEVQARFPELFATWRDQPDAVAIPGAERVAEVGERVREGWRRLVALHGADTVCLVAHGVAIRLLILEALGLPPARLWSVQVGAAAVSEIESGDRWATLHRLNVAPHLDRLPGASG